MMRYLASVNVHRCSSPSMHCTPAGWDALQQLPADLLRLGCLTRHARHRCYTIGKERLFLEVARALQRKAIRPPCRVMCMASIPCSHPPSPLLFPSQGFSICMLEAQQCIM